MINKRKWGLKIIGAVGIFVILALLALFMFSGDNFDLLRSIFMEDHSDEELREKLADFGIKGYITIVILSMLQVVVTFLPAEPVQVLAGLTFGFPIGLLCCTIGVVIGNTLVYTLYKLLGDKMRDYFIKNLHLDLDRASRSGKITLFIFILYFLPAIPYGMICFFAASVGMKYHRFITITVLGAIPSVCIGVGLGHMAIATNWIVSLVVFGVLIILIAVIMANKNKIFNKVNERIAPEPYSSKTKVRKYKPSSLILPHVISRIILFVRGVRVKYTSNVGKLIETPSIVLCNHGSFIDFVYAGTILRRQAPNFVVARMYFYKKNFGNLLRRFGCFPKSMFAMDIESAKNCLSVTKNGGILAMMPEARLSTAGKFEDIQEGTWAFIKKSNVPVYIVKISGDYFASPKWGDGVRRGSRVEVMLDRLFTKEDVEALSTDEIRSKALDALYYDEFEWLKKNPKIRYKKNSLAHGLENILSRCPVCDRKYTIVTKGHKISCECCGEIASLNNRYLFEGGAPFENFSLWYDWQCKKLKDEIEADPNWSMSSSVELKLPSNDGRTSLRHAGDGICTLDRSGLSYVGTLDDEQVTLKFPAETIYRLLFGAGENFEIYVGQKIHYFVPEEKRSSVDWYIASSILFGS